MTYGWGDIGTSLQRHQLASELSMQSKYLDAGVLKHFKILKFVLGNSC